MTIYPVPRPALRDDRRALHLGVMTAALIFVLGALVAFELYLAHRGRV